MKAFRIAILTGIELIWYIFTVIIVATCFWVFKPEWTVPLSVFLPLIITMLLIIIFLIKAFLELSFQHTGCEAPKFITIENDKYIFEPSDRYKTRSVVILVKRNKFTDTILGYGIITSNPGHGEPLQVEVKSFTENKSKDYFKNQQKDILLEQYVLYEDIDENLLNKIRGIND